MRIFTVHDLENRLKIPQSRHSTVCSGVSVDSRYTQPGQLFIALPGSKTSGSNYVREAVSKGATAAIVDENFSGPIDIPLLKVPDTLLAFQQLAHSLFDTWHPKIAAITGSVGKSTTKEFLRTILQERYKTAASKGNQNSQIGLPLSLLNETSGEEEALVLEMGMTEKGHIRRLVDIAPPDIVVITRVDLVHAKNFESIHEIARAKAEIMSHPKTQIAVIHRDIENFAEIKNFGTCRKISFGMHSQDADYSGSLLDQNISQFPLRGIHLQHNFLAAVIVAREWGLTWEEIRLAIPKLRLLSSRMEEIEKDGVLFLNDSYNAAEISVKAALDSLPTPKKGGRRFAVLGEMLELGKYSEECHRRVATHALDKLDGLFLIGPGTQPMQEVWSAQRREVDIFCDKQALKEALKKQILPGDVVLIKGSRFWELGKIVEEW